MMELVHPNSVFGLVQLCRVLFFSRKTWPWWKNMICKLLFIKMSMICNQIDAPSMTLWNFDGYFKSMKWSFQSRPVTRFANIIDIGSYINIPIWISIHIWCHNCVLTLDLEVRIQEYHGIHRGDLDSWETWIPDTWWETNPFTKGAWQFTCLDWVDQSQPMQWKIGISQN